MFKSPEEKDNRFLRVFIMRKLFGRPVELLSDQDSMEAIQMVCKLFGWYAKLCTYEHVIRVYVRIGSHKVVKLDTVLFSD